MTPTRILIGLCLFTPCLHAVDMVPTYAITDRFVTGPTMLVRTGADGELREIWSGMDPKRTRHVPLFLETSIHAEVRRGGQWLDLRTLKYADAGTRPGTVRLKSEDGTVSIDVTSRRYVALSPIFVRYSFSNKEDVRLTTQFKYPDFTRDFSAADAAGWDAFGTLWRGENAVLTTTDGPRLFLATAPAGKTLSIGKDGMQKEIDGTQEVLLCIDATDRAVAADPEKPFVSGWTDALGGTADSAAQVAASRVSIRTDDAQLDKMFAYSLDALRASQFVSGDVMADVFFYRDSWLRDGTYSMMGLALAGDYPAVDRYFSFWDAQRDFSVGGEREAQQPAIAIEGMWMYSRVRPSGASFLQDAWPYVKYYADYYVGRVQKEGMLHLAEEWICFIPAPSSWPNAEVYGGLRAAAKIAGVLGHDAEVLRWNDAADRLQREFLDRAYDKAKARIIPMAGPAGESFTDPDYPKAENRNGPLRDDRVDAGMLIIGRAEAFGKNQGIIAVDDPRFTSTQAQVMRDLENPDHSIFRFGPNPGSPHAPQGELDTWPIIISWAAQDQWLLGNTDLAWRYLQSGILNKRGYDMDAMDCYLPEYWDRKGVPDKQMITWSNGEFVTSTLLFLLGIDLEPEGADLGLAPSLPPGVDHARIDNFRFRNWRLNIELTRRKGLIDVRVTADGTGKELAIRKPTEGILHLEPGREARFSADPARYFDDFGRSRNAPQRAAILSRILAGKEPRGDLDSMAPGQIQDYILKLQADFVPTAQ